MAVRSLQRGCCRVTGFTGDDTRACVRASLCYLIFTGYPRFVPVVRLRKIHIIIVRRSRYHVITFATRSDVCVATITVSLSVRKTAFGGEPMATTPWPGLVLPTRKLCPAVCHAAPPEPVEMSNFLRSQVT